MHTLLALLSLALAAAVFLQQGWVCLHSSDPRAALADRWRTERPLWGDSVWELRRKMAMPLYGTALFVLLFGRVFLHESKLYTITPDWVYGSLYLLYAVSYILLTVKYFFCTAYSLRQCVISAICFLTVCLAISPCFDENRMALMGFVLCFKDLDWRRILRWFLILGLLMTAVLAVFSLCGLIDVWYQPSHRLELGYENPNHLSRVLFCCACAFFLLLPHRFRRCCCLWLLAPLLAFVMALPRTRSVQLSLLLLIVLTLLYPVFFSLYSLRPVRVLLAAVPLLLTAAGCFMAWYSNSTSPVWIAISKFSNGRLWNWQLATGRYTPRLLGQQIVYSLDDLIALDNSYLELLLAGGLLLFAAIMALQCILIWQLLRSRRYWLVSVTLCWLLYGFFEAFLFSVFTNFTLLLLAPLLFGLSFPNDGTPESR